MVVAWYASTSPGGNCETAAGAGSCGVKGSRQDAREQHLSIVDRHHSSDEAGVSIEGGFEEGVRQQDRVFATHRQATERWRPASEIQKSLDTVATRVATTSPFAVTRSMPM